MPLWLHILSIAFLLLGGVCALVIAVDEIRHPQHMAVMNLVWPLIALSATVIGAWGYFRYGRMHTHGAMNDGHAHGEPETPFAVAVAKSTAHCGAGCTLGDIVAEWLAFFVPGVAVWFGWRTLFDDKMFAVWALDFVFAFVLGIAFQYFAIKPIRKLSARAAIVEAIKADVLSLTAWQVGMYGVMALAQFYLFGLLMGIRLVANTPEFWFTMQIAMVAGFATSYPVNRWLIDAGIKEAM